jgi:endonuclease-3 related protein
MGMLKEKDPYENVRLLFEKSLPQDVNVYKEFHALIVKLAKENCRKVPKCESCPLAEPCRYSRRRKK